MLDNWTEEQFWAAVTNYEYGEFEQQADYYGRICITNEPELEKVWDQFVKAYQDLKTMRDVYAKLT